MKATNSKSFTTVVCWLTAFTGLVLSSCASDGSDLVVPDLIREGRFVDSPVEGLFHASRTETGVTNALGTFRYAEGEDVVFSIGDIELGSSAGGRFLTPLDLVPGASGEADPTVTNIARFLQTLDADGNPNNGIVITEAVRSAAVGRFVEFHQTTASFEQDAVVTSVVADLTELTGSGMRPLVSTQAARVHLRNTLLGLLGGVYKGNLSGSGEGTWTFMVHAGGEVIGYGAWSDGTRFDIAGQVGAASESITYLRGRLSNGIEFFGSVSFAGEVFGSWDDPSNDDIGTLSGARD
jgi:hypothetical protein